MERDPFIRKLLNDPTKIEAREWLKIEGVSCFLGELDSEEETRDLIEHIYLLGAENIWILEVEIFDSGQNSGKLLIELPAMPDARRNIFKWDAVNSMKRGFDATEDVGQPFLFVMLD